MKRINITSGAPWEDVFGYSRAVKAGNVIEVSGTTAVENGVVMHKGNAYLQTKLILEIISKALKEAGASMKDVVRTRAYVTDISLWQEIGKAHSEVFGNIKPAATMVEVKALINPDMLIEIEATAIISNE